MKDIKSLTANITGGSGRAHAYIIEGKAGNSREEFVKYMLSALLCREEHADMRPCGVCDACVQVAVSTSPDVVYMMKSGKSGYKVDDATQFMTRLSMSPYGRYLIGVIDNAELMSEVVQNKLLKTLEEPLEDVIILLATGSSDELLSTVRSRCSLIRMQEYEGYSHEDLAYSEDLMSGAAMLIAGSAAFYEFREFTEKNIKTNEDAFALIAIAEKSLQRSMNAGKAVSLCADRIEKAEKTAMDISKGMDKSKALKRLFLEINENKAHIA